MRQTVKLPVLGDTTKYGVIRQWLVALGARVEANPASCGRRVGQGLVEDFLRRGVERWSNSWRRRRRVSNWRADRHHRFRGYVTRMAKSEVEDERHEVLSTSVPVDDHSNRDRFPFGPS